MEEYYIVPTKILVSDGHGETWLEDRPCVNGQSLIPRSYHEAINAAQVAANRHDVPVAIINFNPWLMTHDDWDKAEKRMVYPEK